MTLSRTATVLGVGLTTFLVVTAIVTELAASAIAFSLFIGLPAGLLSGVVAAWIAHRRLSHGASSAAHGVLTGIAATGYAVFGLFAVRYAVAATQSVLSMDVVVIAAVAIGAAAGLAVGIRAGRPAEAAD